VSTDDDARVVREMLGLDEPPVLDETGIEGEEAPLTLGLALLEGS
jgi:hypothetical protein